MFTDLLKASDARKQSQTQIQKLFDRVENGIMNSVSVNNFSVNFYLTEFEFSVVHDELIKLGYEVHKGSRCGSLTYNVNVTW